jgi:hypothetical protein
MYARDAASSLEQRLFAIVINAIGGSANKVALLIRHSSRDFADHHKYKLEIAVREENWIALRTTGKRKKMADDPSSSRYDR